MASVYKFRLALDAGPRASINRLGTHSSLWRTDEGMEKSRIEQAIGAAKKR